MNATLYLADPSLLGSRLFQYLEDIDSFEGIGPEGKATGLLLNCSWGKIQFNFMSDEELPEHLNGLSGYVRRFSSGEDTVYLQSRIRHIRLCMGCVIEAEPDAEEQIANFLLEFAVNSRGLLFMNETLYDCFDGPMAGPLLSDRNE